MITLFAQTDDAQEPVGNTGRMIEATAAELELLLGLVDHVDEALAEAWARVSKVAKTLHHDNFYFGALPDFRDVVFHLAPSSRPTDPLWDLLLRVEAALDRRLG